MGSIRSRELLDKFAYAKRKYRSQGTSVVKIYETVTVSEFLQGLTCQRKVR
jgi:hypothetical protein